MTLLELPRRRAAPRTFVEPPADLSRRIKRALDGLAGLPECFLDVPCFQDSAELLIRFADDLDEASEDLEDDELGADEALPLFEWSTRRP